MKDLGFSYESLIFIVNMFGLFLWKINKGIAITTAFQKNSKNLIEHQTKYGLIKIMIFLIDEWNHG